MKTSNKNTTYKILKNTNFVGYVNAPTHAVAMARATGLYGRCEILACGGRAINKTARHADSYSHGRRPYPVIGLEERRAALIAAHKAGTL